jgi:hypothetical protein
MTNRMEWMLRWAESREGWFQRLLCDFSNQLSQLGGTEEDTRLANLASNALLARVHEYLQIDSHPLERFSAASMAVMVIEAAHRVQIRDAKQSALF